MPVSPSADNYTLGRGIVYFDKLESTVYQGERDLGNANSVTVNVAIDTLDHFSNRSGLKAKDKKVVLQITPTISFTLDEINYDNVQLVFMADRTDVSQTADTDGITAMLTAIQKARYYSVGEYRNIAGAVLYLRYDTGATIPVAGETLTGAVSADTAVVVSVIGNATEGICIVNTCAAGDFNVAELINGSVGGAGIATTNGSVAQTAAAVPLVTNAAGTTIYTVTTDYTVDSASGRIFITAASTMTAAANYYVVFTTPVLAYKKIQAFNETSIEGRLRFIPDNPVGNNMELFIHRCDLTPEGDVQLIADEWQALSFTGEILKDETNNPASPYMNIYTTDV